MFDPIAEQPYTQIGFDAISSEASRALALDASRQAQVLLKNAADALPLKKGVKILLTGPHATTTQDLGDNYFEDIMPATCGSGPDGSSESGPLDTLCVPSMEKALAGVSGAAAPTVIPGCKDTSCVGIHPLDFSKAIAAAKTADVVRLGNDDFH